MTDERIEEIRDVAAILREVMQDVAMKRVPKGVPFVPEEDAVSIVLGMERAGVTFHSIPPPAAAEEVVIDHYTVPQEARTGWYFIELENWPKKKYHAFWKPTRTIVGQAVVEWRSACGRVYGPGVDYRWRTAPHGRVCGTCRGVMASRMISKEDA